AQEATLRGLSCLGDMVATCSSPLSRNKRFGYLLGKGKKPDEARDEISPDGQAIEGLESLQGLLLLAKKYGIELPITSEIDAISKGSTTPLRAIRRLMKRELKEE
ncbi:MAG: glycerol-3-phosphate dehydrogenase, partial [Caldisericales bacterium]|nr:glycerol-3-phosphate dehydrogenase [Caldisericales bacterium]